MLFAWSVSPFIGIFVARYLKHILGVWWYRIHLFLMLGVTGLFSIAGFVIVYNMNSCSIFMDSAHEKIGLSVIIILIGQIVLGFISNALWTPDRTYIPWWDKVHWWLGRGVFILGIVNISLGINLYMNQYNEPIGILYAYWICIAIGFGFMVFGQIKFGQVRTSFFQSLTFRT